MDRPQWPQEIVVKPMEEIVTNSTTYNNNNIPSKPSSSSTSSFERRVIRSSSSTTTTTKAAPHVNCPRCDSTNTKFCYYNNYSLSQPRYFCKTCRRYWTEGGTLRNIPVGGGSRKNKRSSSSYSSTSVSKKLNDSDDLYVPPGSTSVLLSQNPRIHHQQQHQGHYGHYYGQDLNLGFPSSSTTISTTTSGSAQLSAMELLNGITTRGGTNTTTTTTTTSNSSRMNSFMPIPITIHDPNSVYNSSSSGAELMIPMMAPEFKIPSSLGFSLDGMGANGGYGNSSNTTTTSLGGILFPFEEEDDQVKRNTQTSTTHEDGQPRDHNQNGDSNGFWNGMLGGGGSW